MTTLLEEFLSRLAEDEVADGEVLQFVSAATGIEDGDTLRAMSLGLIAEVILRGWAVPTTYGTLWNLEPWAAIERIGDDGYDHRSDNTEVCRLEATTEGRRLGIEVAERTGEWEYRWDGTPFASTGHFSRRTGKGR